MIFAVQCFRVVRVITILNKFLIKKCLDLIDFLNFYFYSKFKLNGNSYDRQGRSEHCLLGGGVNLP